MNNYWAVKVLFMKNVDGFREDVIVISLKEADIQNNVEADFQNNVPLTGLYKTRREGTSQYRR
jgi:hypothetical protein